MFPLQGAQSVPWIFAERAYRYYAQRYGRDQSLERLAERGGFGASEFACLYLWHLPQERFQRNADGVVVGPHDPAICAMRVGRALGQWPFRNSARQPPGSDAAQPTDDKPAPTGT